MSAYTDELQRLMGEGWTPEQGVPESLIEASNADKAGSVGVGAAPGSGQPPALGGAGTMEDPMQLSTMMIQGTPPGQGGGTGGPPQPGAAPQAGGGVGVFAGMSDEDADQYGAMGDLRRQMGQAEAMRDTGDAEGRTVNRGRTFVAASPLEHLMVGAKRYKGKKDTKRIGEEQTKGRTSIIDLLRGVNRDEEELDENTLIDGMDIDETTRYA